MVYKYQKETIKCLIELTEKLENITEKRMTLKIGFWRGEYYHGNEEYNIMKGKLHIHLNYGNIFSVHGFIEENGVPVVNEFDVISDDDYIVFDEDLFLKLNDWISEIYQNKMESEKFHRELNLDLCTLLKTL